MDSQWEPLPSDVAEWMGMEADVPVRVPTPRVRSVRRRHWRDRVAEFRLHLAH